MRTPCFPHDKKLTIAVVVAIHAFVLMVFLVANYVAGIRRAPAPSGGPRGPCAIEEHKPVEEPSHTIEPADRPEEKIPVEPGSPLEDYLDQIRYCELQMEAVIVDMHLYLGWLPDEKDEMTKAAKKALSRLRDVRDRAVALSTPESCSDITELFLDGVSGLEKLYTDVADKDGDEIAAVTAEWAEVGAQYVAKGRRFKRTSLAAAQDEASELQPDSWLEAKDKYRYEHAVQLMAKRDYRNARVVLEELQADYPDNAFILLHLADSTVKAYYIDIVSAHHSDIEEGRDGNADGIEPEKAAAQLLGRIVDGDEYSPVLSEAFLKWRTLAQDSTYGPSNSSEIPNWEYNEKRMRLVGIIRTHIEGHPDDSWAKYQKLELLTLPNITRRELTGNSNLFIWGMLYGLEGLLESLPQQLEGEAP